MRALRWLYLSIFALYLIGPIMVIAAVSLN